MLYAENYILYTKDGFMKILCLTILSASILSVVSLGMTGEYLANENVQKKVVQVENLSSFEREIERPTLEVNKVDVVENSKRQSEKVDLKKEVIERKKKEKSRNKKVTSVENSKKERITIEKSLKSSATKKTETDTMENICDEKECKQELFYDSLEEVAVCVNAEAQNQGYYGMYYVACVIFNRVNSSDYPNTFHGVISQPYQFSSYSDGGMQRWCNPSEECYKAVWDAYNNNQYPGLIYFREGRYSDYGTPAFQYRDHYFSTK